MAVSMYYQLLEMLKIILNIHIQQNCEEIPENGKHQIQDSSYLWGGRKSHNHVSNILFLKWDAKALKYLLYDDLYLFIGLK